MKNTKKQKTNRKNTIGSPQKRGSKYDVFREKENKKYFEELLAMERSEHTQKRLLRVLSHKNDISEKIDIVERVNTHGVSILESYEAQIMAKNVPDPGMNTKSIENGAVTPSILIDTDLEITGLFRYLFHEWSTISEFGRKHRVLKSRIFLLRHELTDIMLRYWNVELKVILQFIEEPLQLLIEEGWSTLSVKQYNLAATLYDLFRTYRDNNLLHFEHRVNQSFFKKLIPFMRIYFQLCLEGDYKELLLDGMTKFLKNIKSFKPVLRKIINAAQNLFDLQDGPGLRNCLLAYFMVCYRRFYTEEELVTLLEVQPIVDDFFICPRRIQEKISQFIEIRQKELADIERNLQFLKEMQIAPLESVEKEVLVTLYTLFSSEGGARVKEQISGVSACKQQLNYDLVSFFEKLLSNFIHILLQLTTDGVFLEGQEKNLLLFEEHYMDKEIHKLKQRLEKLRSLKQGHNRMTVNLDFYRAFVRQVGFRDSYSDTERSYGHLFIEIAADCYSAALKINSYISGQKNKRVGSGINKPDDQPEVIPLHSIITGPDFFMGVTLLRMLEIIVEQAIGVSLLLEDPTLTTLVRRKKAMEHRAQDLRDSLGNMI